MTTPQNNPILDLLKEQNKLLKNVLEMQNVQLNAIIKNGADIEKHLVEGAKRQDTQIKYLRNISTAATLVGLMIIFGFVMTLCNMFSAF